MGDLDLIVEFGAIANTRIFESAAIDSGIGAYFNVIANRDTTDLGNFFPDTAPA